MDQPGKVANPARGQLNRGITLPCPRSRLRIWSRETGSAVPSRVSSAHSPHSGWIWCLLTGFLPISAAAFLYIFKPPYAIGSVPSLWGHAIAYRWHSLPSVRRHRADKPQGSSKRLLPWHITMDQLICVCVFFPFILDIKFVGRTSRGAPLFPTPTIGMKWACWKYRMGNLMIILIHQTQTQTHMKT